MAEEEEEEFNLNNELEQQDGLLVGSSWKFMAI